MNSKPWIRTAVLLALVAVLAGALAIGCSGSASVPPDEALARARNASGDYADYDEYGPLGQGPSRGKWEAAAKRYSPPASLDYFEDMDVIGVTAEPGAKPLKLVGDQVI